MPTHPTDRQLIEFALGEANAGTEEHLRGPCPRCQARLGQYEALVRTMSSDRTPEPPAEWVERAIALRSAGRVRTRIREWCEGLREDLARLCFDSRAGDLTLAGTRHVAADRRLRFESRGIELDLHVEPRGGGAILTGQLSTLEPSGQPVAGAAILVTADDRELRESETDELGEFSVTVSRLQGVRLRVRTVGSLVTFSIPDDDPVP
jgi:hypothetical protein